MTFPSICAAVTPPQVLLARNKNGFCLKCLATTKTSACRARQSQNSTNGVGSATTIRSRRSLTLNVRSTGARYCNWPLICRWQVNGAEYPATNCSGVCSRSGLCRLRAHAGTTSTRCLGHRGVQYLPA